MKRSILIGLWMTVAMPIVYGQSSIQDLLYSIEQNNKELQANEQLTQARKLTDRADNNLPDPSVSYSYQFGSPEELGKTGELTITQSFDFPTAYGARHKLNRQKADGWDRQFALTRQNILLQAKELCLTLIRLNKENELLKLRYENIESLAALFEQHLQTGDASILETNKIRLELMNVKTALAANEADRQTQLQELTALNGNQPVAFEETAYPFVGRLESLETVKQQVLPNDLSLLLLENESKTAHKQVTVNKSGWLPQIEIGYRRNTGTGELFNGFIVGGSLPLFSNKNKVKAAKAQALSADLQQENARQAAEAALTALYNEAATIYETMQAYDLRLLDENDQLLKKALEERQISITEYFTEIGNSIQTRTDYLQLENRYQQIVGQLYKHLL